MILHHAGRAPPNAAGPPQLPIKATLVILHHLPRSLPVPCCQAEASHGAGLYYRKASDTTRRGSQGAPAVARCRFQALRRSWCRPDAEGRVPRHTPPGLAAGIWCGSLPVAKHLAPSSCSVGDAGPSSAAGAAPPTLSTHLHSCQRHQCKRITLTAPHSHLLPSFGLTAT